MRLIPIATIATLLAAAAPLAAQEAAVQYDTSAPITLEGTAEIVVWDMVQGALILTPAGGGAGPGGAQEWEIALPRSKVLLDMGISAEVLSRGAPVKVRAYRARNDACKPRCKAQAVELTLPRQGKSYALTGAQGAG